MTGRRPTRRRILAAVGVGGTGALVGCSSLSGDDSPAGSDETSRPPSENGESPTNETPPTEPSNEDDETPSQTDKPTETSTPRSAEPEIDVTGATLRSDAITVGDPVEVLIELSNAGDADGTVEFAVELDGDAVTAERFSVPAGEDVERRLTGPDTDQVGTVAVAVDGHDIDEVAVEPPAVLHVAPDGAAGNVGTEAAPLGSIDDAVSRARPGDTVHVHPGEYWELVQFHDGGEPGDPITLTGPPEAVLKPPRDAPEAMQVGASHVHIRGLTISGLYNPDEPESADSYNEGKLIDLNTSSRDRTTTSKTSSSRPTPSATRGPRSSTASGS